MTQITTYHRPQPDTAIGHTIVVKHVYSSSDKAEIDELEELFESTIGAGRVVKALKGEQG